MKLHAIIAKSEGAKQKYAHQVERFASACQKVQHFDGMARNYRPRDDDGERLPGESQKVVTTATSLIDDLDETFSQFVDYYSTREHANAQAKADLQIGTTVVPDVPVTLLVWLERELVFLRNTLAKLPVLDPTRDWKPDGDVFKSEVRETTRAKKVPRNHVLSEATDKFPAQVQTYTEDVVVGYWDTTDFTGRLTRQEYDQLQDKLDEMIRSVVIARQEANTANYEQGRDNLGTLVSSYLFDGIGKH